MFEEYKNNSTSITMSFSASFSYCKQQNDQNTYFILLLIPKTTITDDDYLIG